MQHRVLTPEFSEKITALYDKMEKSYDVVAEKIDLSCTGCPDNCCDSFFLHHTYTEWAYLWEGLSRLPSVVMADIKKRSWQYVEEFNRMVSAGVEPVLMCPLNQEGTCALYSHRLMICRMHGVPSFFNKPDGSKVDFPGCFLAQEKTASHTDYPAVDRTEMYRELAGLERQLLEACRQPMPRVKMTIAEMIIKGKPTLTSP